MKTTPSFILSVFSGVALLAVFLTSCNPSGPIDDGTDGSQYELLVDVRGEGNIAPGDSTYDDTTTVALTATADEGWYLYEWTGTNGSEVTVVDSAEGKYQIPLNSNKHITAVFRPIYLTVPSMYTTIQAAIDSSFDGDTILVSPGTYKENIVFKGRKVTVRSTDPQDSATVATTIIDGNEQGRVVTFSASETNETVLWGFTITGGKAGSANSGGGIIVADHSSPLIKGCVIRENTALHGGGALVTNGSAPTFDGNTFINNTAIYGRGAGIYIIYQSEPTITGNIFRDHVDGNGVIHVGGSNAGHKASATITDNIIDNNITDFGVGGISVTVESNATITGNTISNNVASGDNHGGAISVTSESWADISDNTITDNRAKNAGAIVFDDNPGVKSTVTGNTITGNQAGVQDDGATGGGIKVSYYGDVEITGNTISNNKAWNSGHGGGGIAIYDWGQETKATIRNNIITNNQAYRWGGGIYLRGGGVTATITDNTISANNAEGYGSSNGGGIYVRCKEAVIFGNTIEDNYAEQHGGGVFVDTDVPVYGDAQTPWVRMNCPDADPEENNTYSENTHGNDRYRGADVFFWENRSRN